MSLMCNSSVLKIFRWLEREREREREKEREREDSSYPISEHRPKVPSNLYILHKL